jgi:hypothetical protein
MLSYWTPGGAPAPFREGGNSITSVPLFRVFLFLIRLRSVRLTVYGRHSNSLITSASHAAVCLAADGCSARAPLRMGSALIFLRLHVLTLSRGASDFLAVAGDLVSATLAGSGASVRLEFSRRVRSSAPCLFALLSRLILGLTRLLFPVLALPKPLGPCAVTRRLSARFLVNGLASPGGVRASEPWTVRAPPQRV